MGALPKVRWERVLEVRKKREGAKAPAIVPGSSDKVSAQSQTGIWKIIS